MILSEDRLSHLAHLLQDSIWKDDLVDFSDDDQVLREIKRILNRFFSSAEEIDSIVRQKLYTQGRRVVEGSQDWDILYRKYFEEELSKRRF